MLCNIQSSYFYNFDYILLQTIDAIQAGCYKWAAVQKFIMYIKLANYQMV